MPIDRDLVAMDDVEDAVRQAGLLQQLTEIDRCGRVLLARLQDERVPARDRVREHPHRHHRREVERRDARHHAERLADLVDVDPGADLLAESALEQVRDAGGELEVLEAARDLAERIGPDLAVLARQVGRDLLAMLLHEVPDAEHDLGPPADARRAPGRERRVRRGHRRVDLLDGGEVDLRARPARSPGCRPVRCGRTCPATNAPLIQWLTRSCALAASAGTCLSYLGHAVASWLVPQPYSAT